MSAVNTKPGASDSSGDGPGLGGKFRSYWQTLVYEWRKISWPERKQWKDSTIVVFVFTVFLMVILASFDWIVGMFMNQLMNFGS